MNDAAEKELRAAQSKIIDLEQALRQKDVQIDNHHRRLQVVEGSQGGGKMGWWTAFREKGLFEEFSQAEYDFYHFYNWAKNCPDVWPGPYSHHFNIHFHDTISFYCVINFV